MLSSMADSGRRPATYQDVLDAPEHMIAEIIDGELVLQPRPAKPHAMAASALGEELGPPFKRGRGGPGGWIIIDEPEIHLQSHVLVPDLAGWRRERMPAVTTDEAFFTLSPDWVCEVLSPGTARRDRTSKLRIYAEHGVEFVWLVDPLLRTLEVYKRSERVWTLLMSAAEDEHVRAQPFDAIELELAVLWADVQLPPEP
jgi:Uma2 family endonuclease